MDNNKKVPDSTADKVMQVFSDSFKSLEKPLISIARTDDCVQITLSKMYEYVECEFCEFSHLSELSELFGTRKINIGNRTHNDGCETCDYGSSYEFTIFVNGCTKGLN